MERGTAVARGLGGRATDLDKRVLSAMRRRPGLTVAQLRVAVQAGFKTTLAAVTRLEAEGLAFHGSFGRRSCFFAGQPPPAEERTQLAVLVPTGTRKVARALVEAGKADITILANKAGLRPRTAYTHAEALVRVGLAEAARVTGLRRVLTPTGSLIRALARFTPERE